MPTRRNQKQRSSGELKEKYERRRKKTKRCRMAKKDSIEKHDATVAKWKPAMAEIKRNRMKKNINGSRTQKSIPNILDVKKPQ